jgi:hypothetical protein
MDCVAGGDTAEIWKGSQRATVGLTLKGAAHVAISPDDRYAVFAGSSGEVLLWNAQNESVTARAKLNSFVKDIQFGNGGASYTRPLTTWRSALEFPRFRFKLGFQSPRW